MPTDAQILQKIQSAFAERQRPEHFTNYTHCEECAEHDQVLRSRDVHSLRIEDVGNPGWDPICFTSPEGFAYYLPALARLALAQPAQPHGWYGPQLFFHLSHDGCKNQRFLACTRGQRRVMADYLRHLIETTAALVEGYGCTDDLFQAVEIWSDDFPGM